MGATFSRGLTLMSADFFVWTRWTEWTKWTGKCVWALLSFSV